MSLHLFSQALNDFEGSPPERLVMLALADLADDGGIVLVVPQEIGLKARLPVGEALQVLRAFVEDGVLQQKSDMRRMYQIDLTRLSSNGAKNLSVINR